MTRSSPEIGQNSDGCMSDFWISGQSFVQKNYHIDIKLRPVTKLDKRNTTTSKNYDIDVMLVNCDVIIFILIYGQFPSIRKPDSRISALILFLCVKILFLPKLLIFYKKNAGISKIKSTLVLKGILSEATYVCTYVPNFKFLA